MPYDLSDRELQVLRLVASGQTDREIGDALFISVLTVKSHFQRIQTKVGVATREELIRRANEEGLG